MNRPRRIEYVALGDIERAAENVKLHDDDGIAASIERHGFIDAGILDGRTGRLLGGHGRLDYLERLRDSGDPPPDGIVVRKADKEWLVPVQTGWSSADDDEADAAALALNQLTIAGGFAEDPLAAMLQRLSERSGLAGTGFSNDDLTALLERTRVPDFAPTDPDEQPRLDQRKKVTCPACGEEFEPK